MSAKIEYDKLVKFWRLASFSERQCYQEELKLDQDNPRKDFLSKEKRKEALDLMYKQAKKAGHPDDIRNVGEEFVPPDSRSDKDDKVPKYTQSQVDKLLEKKEKETTAGTRTGTCLITIVIVGLAILVTTICCPVAFFFLTSF